MLAIVCHDAGGAEIISSYIKQNPQSCLYVLDGPALNIFRRKLGSIKITSMDDALKYADRVLCGTSWKSDIERVAIQQAKLLKKESICFLDHWVNYLDRFYLCGDYVFPDAIWVGDFFAYSLAEKIFSECKIKLVENPYFKEIVCELNTNKKSKIFSKKTVLYICEPIKEHALIRYGNARYFGYTEEEAIEFAIDNIGKCVKGDFQIVLRLHPSEKVEKYAQFIKKFKVPINIGNKSTLIEEIACSDIVIGCESMGMVVGLLANKRVISCIPKNGKPCSLPYQEIEHLRDML